ncbi:hypothetical protein K440DRAFT_659216, partial [Wilcoxina mikolae CBS 423.85]
MVDFNFPDAQLLNRHEMWLKDQLLLSVPRTKVKDLKVYRDLGLQRRLPGPKTVGVRKTQNGVQLSASIVVESLNDTAYKALKRLYQRPTQEKKISNLIIFHWVVDDNKVTVLWNITHTSQLLRRCNIIEIPRSDFSARGDGSETVELDVSALRNEIRDTVDTFCRDEGYTAAGIADEIPLNTPKPPTTREEFQTALGNITQILGLGELYDEEQLRAFAEKASRNIEGALTDMGLPKSATMSLTKVNLFKAIIFCDDSGSMAGALYNRILREAVQRLVPLATRLNENGVSLRFINFDGDGGFNDLKEDDVLARLDSVRPGGGTMIGAALDRKVVQPLVTSLDYAASIHPMLVSIITDGEANDEDAFERTILRCKQ